ncbi:hypothetical protein QR685DRAFT_510768 [Neurospora intermedia]|uniref:Uncharacterized protein n=1 Tax=Neurospora intermedia TaxID=5142 RepID=A0ABR3DQ27_NEUIN
MHADNVALISGIARQSLLGENKWGMREHGTGGLWGHHDDLPFPGLFLCFLPLPESTPARPGHDITRLTGKIPLFARPIPSMWHSTTAHQPICQHNQKVHRQTEEEEEGIAYPIHAREEGPSQDVSHYHFPVHCSSGVEFSLTQTAISLVNARNRTQ